MLQCEQWQLLRVEGGRDRPTDDSPTEDIGDERDVAEPGEYSDIGGGTSRLRGNIGNPELLRPVRNEPPVHQVETLILSGRGTRGDGPAASANALKACDLHQPRDLVSAHVHPTCRMACHIFRTP